MKNLIYPFFTYLNLFAVFFLGIFFVLIIFKKTRDTVFVFVKRFGYQLIFLVSLLAMVGSLAFSEVLGWVPCKLCWYQRILMYPQVLISLIALKINDQKGYYYHFWLSFFGFFIALFHYLIQRGVIQEVDCNLIAASGACAIKINFAFGFISIPFMAVVAFLVIILVAISNIGKI